MKHFTILSLLMMSFTLLAQTSEQTYRRAIEKERVSKRDQRILAFISEAGIDSSKMIIQVDLDTDSSLRAYAKNNSHACKVATYFSKLELIDCVKTLDTFEDPKLAYETGYEEKQVAVFESHVKSAINAAGFDASEISVVSDEANRIRLYTGYIIYAETSEVVCQVYQKSNRQYGYVAHCLAK